LGQRRLLIADRRSQVKVATCQLQTRKIKKNIKKKAKQQARESGSGTGE